ncbi:hypothetical protein [Microbacterium sp. 179-I 3D3 NHS]|uniref:hypothetical protein n=1 Tax=unclassified Microbacterium TaxID=2609290 RepID=UPI0039A31118
MSPSPDGTHVSIDHLDRIAVLSIHPDRHPDRQPGAGATFDALVSEPIVETIEALRQERMQSGAGRVCLLHLDDGSVPPPFAEALYESLRGVCGSLTLESVGTDARITLIRAASRADADTTIAFLAGDPAAFVAGATIDLVAGGAR